MKARKQMLVLGAVIVIGGGILTIGNGCGKTTSASGSGNVTVGAADAPNTTGGPSGGEPVIPGARTVSVLYSKQIVDQFSSCTGVAKPSDATMAMYELKNGAISTYGNPDTVTAPMMMAVISIAGEICRDLINQEIATGSRMFVGFDMNANSLPTDANISDSVSRMALSCWQRNATQVERVQMTDMVKASIGAAEAKATDKTALMICTAALSSFDSIKN